MIPFDTVPSPWSCPVRASGLQFSCHSVGGGAGLLPQHRTGPGSVLPQPAHSTSPCGHACVLFGSNLPAVHQHLPPDCGLLALHLTPPQSHDQPMAQCHPLNVYKHVRLAMSNPKLPRAPPANPAPTHKSILSIFPLKLHSFDGSA